MCDRREISYRSLRRGCTSGKANIRKLSEQNMVIKHSSQAPEGSRRVFIGRIVHSRSLKHLEILPIAALYVNGDGTVAALHDNADASVAPAGFENAETIDLKPSQFLFPGMIDTHLHAPQWPNLALGMEGSLREWIEDWTDPVEVMQPGRSTALGFDLTPGIVQRHIQSAKGICGRRQYHTQTWLHNSSI